MTDNLLTIGELRAKVGVEWEPEIVEVDKSLIQRITHAIDDSNPLWWDEQHAKILSSPLNMVQDPITFRKGFWGQITERWVPLFRKQTAFLYENAVTVA